MTTWLERWDRQQEIYMPRRETCFRIMLDALEHFLGDASAPCLALDLACGTGSISQRLLARFPAAHAVAMDIDPVLMKIGRDALGDRDGRLQWVEADLRLPDWVTLLPERSFDAVLSSTAIHWFDPERAAALYRELAQVMKPGGVFLNFDAVAASNPRIQGYYKVEDDRQVARNLAETQAEDWSAWWDAIAQDGGYDALLEERKRRFDAVSSTGTDDHGVPMVAMIEALQTAGFSAVDTLWQDHRKRIVIALRD